MTEHKVEFTLSENPWAPTAVLAEINERTGSDLELVGLADQVGGTSSAAFVRWPDGRQAALTRTTTPLAVMRQTARVLGDARRAGYQFHVMTWCWNWLTATSRWCRSGCPAARSPRSLPRSSTPSRR